MLVLGLVLVNPRRRSLDVFRGAAVALMILVNNPGSWTALYPQLAHAAWHGCAPSIGLGHLSGFVRNAVDALT